MFTKDVVDKISRWFKGSLLPFLGYDNANEWQFQVPTDIPMQENQVDCALFVMKYADCLTHGDCFPFSPKDMAHFRHRTLLDIYEGSLFQPEFRAKQTVK
ncbi:GRAS domain protein, putative [Theobroma cacao]|uniref:GRAS domain protein, putative n=1 Tax=Theobroma cacao TaxID=3641 RepID=A0A061EHT0_THECC|nr:GRAS domain protein, putative [Theobroma cacao]